MSTAPVDTRTAQQREIDEAKANGTWGIEYTTCQKCGYHNWTRKGNVYVCDTCGNETTTVVSANGVKGYVGNGAIAPIANKSAAPETRYATAKQAQDAADAREAAYAAAVVAFQKPQTKPPIWPPSPSNRLSPQEDCCRRGQQPSFFFFKFFCRPFNFSARRPYRVDVRKNKT